MNMDKEKIILKELLERKITPNECKNRLNLRNNEELKELIKKRLIVKENKTTSLKLNKVNKMTFIEINEFMNYANKKGLSKTQIADELEFEWKKWMITGFDYRYFVESIEFRESKKFLNYARYIGRYEN